MKVLKLRRADVCSVCGDGLPIGAEASWDSEAKKVTCLACAGPTTPAARVEPVRRDNAGASAAREHERRAARELKKKEAIVAADAAWRAATIEKRPVLGRVVTAIRAKPVIGPESQSTKAWDVGAAGERRVGEVLDACDGVLVLHDRHKRGSKANIDHIAVGPAGVYVIDAKKYEGAVEQRNKGTWLRDDLRLYVNGRDRSSVVSGVVKQLAVVGEALTDAGLTAPVAGILCFVGGVWPRFGRRPLTFGAVTALWPDALAERVRAPGQLDAIDIKAIAVALDAALPPA